MWTGRHLFRSGDGSRDLDPVRLPKPKWGHARIPAGASTFHHGGVAKPSFVRNVVAVVLIAAVPFALAWV